MHRYRYAVFCLCSDYCNYQTPTVILGLTENHTIYLIMFLRSERLPEKEERRGRDYTRERRDSQRGRKDSEREHEDRQTPAETHWSHGPPPYGHPAYNHGPPHQFRPPHHFQSEHGKFSKFN